MDCGCDAKTDFVPAQTFTFAYDGGVEVGVVEKE